MSLLDIALSAAAALLLIPTSLLAIEVAAALASGAEDDLPQGERRRVAIVMPAHDEAAGIEDSIRALLPQLLGTDRLVVVADNCSDQTAAVASAAGAEVIVRTDPARRGKGYALDFAVRHLEHDPPEILVVVDADCRVAAGSIDRLTRVCSGTGRPVQALYLLRAPAGAGAAVRIAEFACVLKNRVRAAGLRRLGLPCQLMGTGMAFPWATIRTATLATGHIVEDLKLGLELAGRRSAPLHCPAALVTSFFPTSAEGFKSQRTRWEHGYLGVILRDAPVVILKALATGNGALLALALDLCIPPLALLALLTAGAWTAFLLYCIVGPLTPLVIASVAATLLGASVLLSWICYGREIISLGNLALTAGYVLWKIPLYGKFLVARQIDWVRSKRDPDPRG